VEDADESLSDFCPEHAIITNSALIIKRCFINGVLFDGVKNAGLAREG
jgi:RPA family protein